MEGSSNGEFDLKVPQKLARIDLLIESWHRGFYLKIVCFAGATINKSKKYIYKRGL